MIVLSLLLASLVSSATIPSCVNSARDGIVPVLVQLKAPTAAINRIHRLKLPSDEKAQKLVARLRGFTRNSQKALIKRLKKFKRQGKVKDYRSYFISNTIAVDVAKEVIPKLAKFKGVKEIGCNFIPNSLKRRSNSQIQDSHLSLEYAEYGTDNQPDPLIHPAFYGPAIHQMKVPEVKDDIFKKAASLVFGIQDSGFDFMHQALVDNYKGNKTNHFNHNFTFFDGTRTLENITHKNDGIGHGTSVLSIAVGKKPLGISPQSKWIACKALDGHNNPTERYLLCQQFLLAPTNLEGKAPNALLRPHVIANSWGCAAVENCFTTPFKYTSHAHHVAGIFNAVMAGNEGKRTCKTIIYPPPENVHSFVVAGLNRNSTFGLRISGVGPAAFRTNAIDVAASGQSVLAALPNHKYGYVTGTSYASPLVAGGALLVMAACPHLQRDPDRLARVLRNSSTPLYSYLGCGGDKDTTVPNNEFGYGLVNIKKAILHCKQL